MRNVNVNNQPEGLIMESDIKFKVNAIFGHIELKHFYRQEDDWLVYYGYSIKYDRAGNEVSRTEPTAYSKIR